VRNIDQMLNDLGAPLPSRIRRRQWVRRPYPEDYREPIARALAALG
jgi:hypothetical protein